MLCVRLRSACKYEISIYSVAAHPRAIIWEGSWSTHCTRVPWGLRNGFPRTKTQLVLRKVLPQVKEDLHGLRRVSHSTGVLSLWHQFQSTRESKLQSPCPLRKDFLHNISIFYTQNYSKRLAPSSTRRSGSLSALSVPFNSLEVCTDFHALECAFDYMTETGFSKLKFLLGRMGNREH